MLRTLSTLALVGALSLSACVSGTAEDAAVSAPVPAEPLPVDDGPIPVEPDGGIGDGSGPSGGDAGPATKVEPRPGMANVRARPWDEVAFNADQTKVTIFYTSGVEPCYVLDRVEVEATERAITLTLFEGSDPGQPDAVCIEIAERKAVEVDLGEPLGPRSVLDGAQEG